MAYSFVFKKSTPILRSWSSHPIHFEVGNISLRFWHMSVQKYRKYDKGSAQSKLGSEIKVEQVHRTDTRHDDGKRGSESFENVVSVFDDNSHD